MRYTYTAEDFSRADIVVKLVYLSKTNRLPAEDVAILRAALEIAATMVKQHER